jgi:hypothetical protein
LLYQDSPQACRADQRNTIARKISLNSSNYHCWHIVEANQTCGVWHTWSMAKPRQPPERPLPSPLGRNTTGHAEEDPGCAYLQQTMHKHATDRNKLVCTQGCKVRPRTHAAYLCSAAQDVACTTDVTSSSQTHYAVELTRSRRILLHMHCCVMQVRSCHHKRKTSKQQLCTVHHSIHTAAHSLPP